MSADAKPDPNDAWLKLHIVDGYTAAEAIQMTEQIDPTDASTTETNSFDDVGLDYFVNGRWVHEHDLTEAERVAWLNETLGVSDDA